MSGGERAVGRQDFHFDIAPEDASSSSTVIFLQTQKYSPQTSWIRLSFEKTNCTSEESWSLLSAAEENHSETTVLELNPGMRVSLQLRLEGMSSEFLALSSLTLCLHFREARKCYFEQGLQLYCC